MARKKQTKIPQIEPAPDPEVTEGFMAALMAAMANQDKVAAEILRKIGKKMVSKWTIYLIYGRVTF